MSSTACDDQFSLDPDPSTVTITGTGNSSKCYVVGGGGGGGAGSYHNSYGAVPPLGAGAVGATGSFTIPSGTLGIINSSQWGTLSSTSSYASTVSMSNSILSIMAEGDGDAMIKTKKNTINLDEMAVMMETVKERLLILTPNFELHEKYPVLKDLYEQYKVVEAMLKEDDKK